MNDSLLMIAARAPVAGETKTRLGKAIGMDIAALLYEAFLTDLSERFDRETRPYDLAWTYTPPERDFGSDLERVTGRCAPPSTLFVPQCGPDWGTRQTNLLKWGHDHGYAKTVLMASDSPHLSRETIDEAFAALDTHHVVMGRVRDGGYYLIGMVGHHDVLREVPMSTSSAADALANACAVRGLALAETEPTFDIDEEPDLRFLVETLAADPSLCPVTRAAMAQLGLNRR